MSNPTAPTTFARVQTIIEDQLGVSRAAVTPEADVIVDLGADSLDTVELAIAFEEEFGIDLTEEFDRSKTVQQVVDLIDSKLR